MVVDSAFATAFADGASVPSEWNTLIECSNSRLQTCLDPHHDPELDDEWLEQDERIARDSARRQHAVARRIDRAMAPLTSEQHGTMASAREGEN